jgi:hypothetical protein
MLLSFEPDNIFVKSLLYLIIPSDLKVIYNMNINNIFNIMQNLL